MRGPELPAGCVVKSSRSRCTTSARPITLLAAPSVSEIEWTSTLKRATPLASATRLGSSPAWLPGAANLPCVPPAGLKWPPEALPLSPQSPFSWMWKPCSRARRRGRAPRRPRARRARAAVKVTLPTVGFGVIARGRHQVGGRAGLPAHACRRPRAGGRGRRRRRGDERNEGSWCSPWKWSGGCGCVGAPGYTGASGAPQSAGADSSRSAASCTSRASAASWMAWRCSSSRVCSRVVERAAVAAHRVGEDVAVALVAELAGEVGAAPRQREGQRPHPAAGRVAVEPARVVDAGGHLAQPQPAQGLEPVGGRHAEHHAAAAAAREQPEHQPRVLHRAAVDRGSTS